MAKLKVVLGLITQDNDYQREQASVAHTAAQRLGMELQVVYANSDAIAQTQQLLALIHAGADERPQAVLVEPVGTGMLPVATAAAKNGVAWVALNRESDYLVELRQSARVPVGSVLVDNVEVGRIQGRQFGALLPGGGTMLLIEGPAADVAKQRRAGLEETLPKNIQLQSVRGKWTEESGAQAISGRLARSGAPGVAIVGCQNDAMAMGARKAVEALPHADQRAQWLKLPFTGVDGLPSTGQAWVRKGLLTATVITSALSGLALELLAKAIESGTQMPERTLVKPESFPSIQELGARARGAPPAQASA